MQLILASQSIGRRNLLSLLKIPFQVIPSSLDEDKIIGKNPQETIRLRAKMKGEEILKKVMSYELLVMRNHPPITHNPQPITILSADSGVILGNRLIGKPKDYQDAVRIMKILSGTTHELFTAVYLIRISNDLVRDDAKTRVKEKQACPPKRIPIESGLSEGGTRKFKYETSSSSLVTFRKLSDEDIRIYLKTANYLKFAGGYALFTDQKCTQPTLEDLISDTSYRELVEKLCPSSYNRDLIQDIKGSISNVIGLPLEKVIPLLKNMNLESGIMLTVQLTTHPVIKTGSTML